MKQTVEMNELIPGGLRVWWRKLISLTVEMCRKVEMNGWRFLRKVEIDVEGFYTGRWKNNLGGGDNRKTVMEICSPVRLSV